MKLSIMETIFMIDSQAQGGVSNSPANPLPARSIPLPEARPNSLQAGDRLHIFDAEKGAENCFFPAVREMSTTTLHGS
jgi:hypothetical protein